MEYLLTIGKGVRWVILILSVLYFVWIVIGASVYFLFDPNTSLIEAIKTNFEISLWLSIPVLLTVFLLRGQQLIIASLIPVLLFGVIYIPQLIPRSPEVPPNLPHFTIMTFNLKATSEGIVQVIRNVNADIVALQELSRAGAEAMETLEDIYPYQILHPQADPNAGQGILSRYPIETDEYWEYPDLPHTLGHQRVEIDFDGTQIVIYNTHPWPPLAWATGYNDESHRLVLQDIAERTFNEQLPLLLVGDFNMTENFGEYDLLATRFTDSYRVAGDGIGYTYPNYRYEPLPPMLRLDYIWHSHHFQSIKSTVRAENGGSDHSPVISTIALLDSN